MSGSALSSSSQNDETLAGVQQRMREDWNSRAKEDAYYYVAFGRRSQSDDEFDETAAEVVAGLDWELRRLPARVPAASRALEIGCGPGRLLKPMSQRFGEIHGVDVSDEMIARARERLRGIPHAHVHVGSGSDLRQFASESFDLVYSYAVFQHIPSREVVFSYLQEAVRVVKQGGLIRVQINGLPKTAKVYDTWSGVRVSGDEVREFCTANGLNLLALEGLQTQYMWTTWQKPAPGVRPVEPIAIRRITNAFSSEPVAPQRGRFASISLWVEGLSDAAGLLNVHLEIGGRPAELTYLGRREHDGLRQLNAMLPPDLPTGLQPVSLRVEGGSACPPVRFRIVPAPPPVPRILTVSDGVDLLSGSHIRSGVVKIQIEEIYDIDTLGFTIAGEPVQNLDVFCVDPRIPRHEVNFEIPSTRGFPPGSYPLEWTVGQRRFSPIFVDLGK